MRNRFFNLLIVIFSLAGGLNAKPRGVKYVFEVTSIGPPIEDIQIDYDNYEDSIQMRSDDIDIDVFEEQNRYDSVAEPIEFEVISANFILLPNRNHAVHEEYFVPPY